MDFSNFTYFTNISCETEGDLAALSEDCSLMNIPKSYLEIKTGLFCLQAVNAFVNAMLTKDPLPACFLLVLDIANWAQLCAFEDCADTHLSALGLLFKDMCPARCLSAYLGCGRFAVVFPEVSDPERVSMFASDILLAVRSRFSGHNRKHVPRFVFGMSRSEKYDSFENLLGRAVNNEINRIIGL